METKIDLSVVTPERVVFQEEVELVIVRSTEGELAVLYDHSPLVTLVKESVLNIKKEEGYYPLAVSRGGFAEIKPEKVSILVDSAETPEEIDRDRASRAKKRAEERLVLKDEETDYVRAQAALQRALVRLQAAEKQLY